MKDLKYFEVLLSNNNDIDRSSYGDDSDFTICIKAEREPDFKEAEKFCCEDMKIYDLKYVVSITEISENEAYFNYNMDSVIKIFK